MEAIADAPSPAPRTNWLTEHRRAVIGGLAVLVLAPLLWFVGTRPLGGNTIGAVSPGGAAQGSGAQAGKVAPDFKLKSPDGKTVELRQFRGKPVLLNFWATWCEPCKQEMPELEQLYRQYKDQGLVVLGVSIDSPADAKLIPDFLKQGNPAVGSYTFPVALDQNQDVTRRYHLLGVPSSFFVDKDGVIRVVQPRVMERTMMLDGLKRILPAAQ